MGEPTARTTIGEPVGLHGVGLHSGEAVSLRVLPAAIGNGIVFRTKADGVVGRVPARIEAVVGSRHATTLGDASARVTTVEHLLAALAMAGIDDAWVEIDGGELPALDGSAAPFVRMVEGAGVRTHGGLRRVAEIVARLHLQEAGSEISIEPAPSFQVHYTIDFAAPAIGRQSIAFEPLDRACFVREVAPARTFGFIEDVERLRGAGLARGASLENTVVVDGSRVVNEEGLRWPDEFVRHKVLDLVGDLALFGMPLVGCVRVRCGGHALHHALLRALWRSPDAYRVIEAPGPGAQSS